jgi:hypothetical protein
MKIATNIQKSPQKLCYGSVYFATGSKLKGETPGNFTAVNNEGAKTCNRIKCAAFSRASVVFTCILLTEVV